ncbi:glycosyltransferase 87 family protein [Naasia sp. SYSU D00057]|uniref:glycosyltransferase 87 family protein n=1 Tax=Naasia sp. SYSU D00057 TaxID=2817380 RepID=UPI001B3069EA|nr:glycosyltransferase 87 family protein [Naasia sp. SYSU D00057]
MTERGVSVSRARRIVTGPIGAWAAFVLVHSALALINLLDTVHLPFGDVVQVYRFWMDYAAENGVLVGIDTGWVYPVGALLPMGIAYLFGPEPYGVVWLGLVTLLDAAAFAVLLRRRPAAAWWWVAFLAALGPVALGRLDSVTAPLAILGLLWLSSRPVLAGALLGLGAWIKVWPAALLAAGVLAVRRRSALVLGGAGVSLAVLAAALVLGGGANILGFIATQGSRGLQVEAPVSSWWLWQSVLGLDGARIYYDQEILTYQVLGDGVATASAAMTPLLVAAVAVLLLLALRAMRRDVGTEALLVPLTLALVVAMLVFNKVGSPQFVAWLAAPVLLALVLRRPDALVWAGSVFAIALLTQIVYPWAYGPLIRGDSLAASVLTLRNLGLVAVLALAVRALWRLPGSSHPDPVDRTPTVLTADRT